MLLWLYTYVSHVSIVLDVSCKYFIWDVAYVVVAIHMLQAYVSNILPVSDVFLQQMLHVASVFIRR